MTHDPTDWQSLKIWKMFYQGYDTGQIASELECREYHVYNAMGLTRGKVEQIKAGALLKRERV